MAREGRVVISISSADGIKNICREYMEKLLNVENDWDVDVDCPEVMGPCCLIRCLRECWKRGSDVN